MGEPHLEIGGVTRLGQELFAGLAIAQAREGDIQGTLWFWQGDAAPSEEVRSRTEAGSAVLPVGWVDGLVLIGPWMPNPLDICPHCAETQRLASIGLSPVEIAEHRSKPSPAEWSALPESARSVIASLILHESRQGPRFSRDGRASVVVVDVRSLAAYRHWLGAWLRCPVCERRQRVPQVTRWRTKGVYVGQNSSWRVRPASSARVLRRWYDWRYGPVTHLYKVVDPMPLAMSVAEIPVPHRRDREAGYGRATTYPSSEQVALLEAMERLATMRPLKRMQRVFASYEAVRATALDPRTLGLHESEAYHMHPGLSPFDPVRPYHWVRGYSFVRHQAVLVPETVVFYAHNLRDEAGSPERFVQETSNGCAVGTTREEAALYGLLELIERDAFLMTWYAKRPPARVDLHRVAASEGFVLDWLDMWGYDVDCFDIGTEVGIPCLWVLARARRSGLAATFSAASAHFDAEKAFRAALGEVATTVAARRQDGQGDVDELRSWLKHPERVRTLDDHIRLYTIPEAAERLEFVVGTPRRRTLTELTKQAEALVDGTRDLGALLERIVTKLRAVKVEDVIAVDVTPPFLAAQGLFVVKTLAPGLLPMTFGHVMRRLRGLDRVYAAARDLHGRVDILDNPWPHPFP